MINYRQQGFSLIELMIAVAIVATLSAFAYTNYQKSVMKSNRSIAKSALLDKAQLVQRYYSANGTYVDSTTAPSSALSALKATGGVKSDKNLYVLSIEGVAKTTYKLKAQAATTGLQSKDKTCATFYLDQKGAQSALDSNGNDSTAKCW